MRTSDPQRDLEILRLYRSGEFLTEHIASTFRLSRRRVLQIVAKYGATRSQADGNRTATPLKRQRRIRRAKTRTP